MLCEPCSFLPVYQRYSLPYGLTLFLVLRIEAAIKFQDFNSLISKKKKNVVQTHSLLRGLCDFSPRLAHDLLCWNRYQRNMFRQMTPTYDPKPGD